MRTSFWIALLLLHVSLDTSAHGLLMTARSDAAQVSGTAYFTNGERAVGQDVVLNDLDAPDDAIRTTTTNERGEFSFPATVGHRYRVAAYGDEGHEVTLELIAGSNAKGQLIDDAPPASESTMPPAWAVISILLALSLIPALVRRWRARARLPTPRPPANADVPS
jgi:hypothetical protein